jgi:hypothetical protein
MKVKVDSSFQILQNYVLIQPDEDHQTMVTKGGLELHVAKYAIENGVENKDKQSDFMAKHFAITGKIVAIPQRMVYHGYRIKEIRDSAGGARQLSYSELQELQRLTQQSLEMDTTCEVVPGDKVWFHYMENINVFQEARVVDTEEYGICYLIKYDSLFCYERNIEWTANGQKFDRLEQFPINGWVWIQQLRYQTEEVMTGFGIYLSSKEGQPKPKQAIIIKASAPIKDYLDSDQSDGDLDLPAGSHIYYNDKFGTPLEHEYHLTQGLPDVLKIRRRHVMGVFIDEPKAVEHGF